MRNDTTDTTTYSKQAEHREGDPTHGMKMCEAQNTPIKSTLINEGLRVAKTKSINPDESTGDQPFPSVKEDPKTDNPLPVQQHESQPF